LAEAHGISVVRSRFFLDRFRIENRALRRSRFSTVSQANGGSRSRTRRGRYDRVPAKSGVVVSDL
jgi:hypothetical protein